MSLPSGRVDRQVWVRGLALFWLLGLAPPGAVALNPNHECLFCHSVHDADGSQLKNDEDVEVLCLTCHGPTGISSFKADVHTNEGTQSAYATFRITCMRCHNPHDGQLNWLATHTHPDASTWDGINIKLVGRADPDYPEGAIIETFEWAASAGTYVDGARPVVFEQRGDKLDPDLQIHSFSDEDRDANGVKDGPCEVCHTQTAFHCNGDATNTGGCGTRHNTGATCTECHRHDTYFLPGGGGQPGGGAQKAGNRN